MRRRPGTEIGGTGARVRGLLLVALAQAALLLGPAVAEARKFDFKSESIATFFGGTWGPSALGTDPYGDASGSETSFDQKIRANYGAEFGFLLATKVFNLKLSGELVMPQRITDIEGSDGAGTKYFSLSSRTMALVPQGAIELNLLSAATYKVYVGGGGGYAFVSLENNYEFTSAGLTEFPGIADYTEKAAATVPMAQAYTGVEALFVDNITAAFNVGYRYLKVASLKHTKDVVAISGSSSKGDELKNSDGGTRALDLSGVYVGLAFRFYIGL